MFWEKTSYRSVTSDQESSEPGLDPWINKYCRKHFEPTCNLHFNGFHIFVLFSQDVHYITIIVKAGVAGSLKLKCSFNLSCDRGYKCKYMQ